MKRWMIVGCAAGAALFGCPLVLAAATQVDEPQDDWVLVVERYANRHARPDVPDPRDLLS